MSWWTPNSPVHDCDGIIADGAIRSGKTLPMSLAYVGWGMATFHDENFGIAGKTIGALRRNVINWLKRTLPGRGYAVRDHRGSEEPHLEIQKGRRTNRFYLFGGNNESSQDVVQGFSGAGFYFDEFPLMPESFLNQAEGRCSVDGSKLWYNGNPEGPNHYVKRNYIDKCKEKNLCHLHFLMSDNWSLSAETIARYERLYAKGSIFYRRFILGEWCAAEGRVFPFFDESPGAGYVVDSVPENYTAFLAGLDFGVSNPFAASLWGFSGGIWYAIREAYWDSKIERKQKINAEYIQDLANLCNWKGQNVAPQKLFVPPEEPGFEREIKQSGYKHLSFARAADTKILPGIQDLTTLLSTGRLKVSRNCPVTIWGLSNLLWDEKKQAQGVDMYIKGGSGSPDHICDQARYISREAARQLRQMNML